MNNPIRIKTPDLTRQHTGVSRPYSPSFVDRIMGAVKRLPIPYWVTYLALFVLLGIANHIVSWADGWIPLYTFNPLLLLYPMWFCFPLAIMTYLNSVSREALSEFAPLLELSNESMQRLEYEFTTMPQKGAILSSMFWAIWYVLLTYLAFDSLIATLGMGQAVLVLVTLEGLVAFLIGSAIYYHSIRQLRLVDRTVALVKEFDLFDLGPVYAFSVVTSRTGIAWALLLALTLVIFPIQLAVGPAISVWVVQVLFAAAAFVLPLRIVNRRLVAGKISLLAEHGRRVKQTLAQLHRSVDEKAFAEAVELNDAISALVAERSILDKIPTWPWRAGVLTGFLSIAVLPIVLLLIQVVVGNWLVR